MTLPSERVTALRAQRAQHIADEKAADDGWKGTGNGLVFTTKNGTPIEPHHLNRPFDVLCTRAGVRKVRFHLCVTPARPCSTNRTPMPA
ncbi:hypothetical protein [Streptomyces pinistramenti]|uniref:hypothetical protein n=1 Tax=Streptomyces pinistramenti TaxID=2884812 RepID=UPI001D07F46D|nr:hypothetical protein [Streptomyces pinistramenti]MCB5910807.1 hypothetical protein [Streptomyces pinistramenti]